MADGKEHRQQEAPQRGADREVQGEVVGGPEPVAETRERNDADRERDRADDGVRDDLLGVDQHAEQGDEASRESGERERDGHELRGQATRARPRSRQCAGDSRIPAATYAARGTCGPFIQRGNVVNRKPKMNAGSATNNIRNECAQIGATARSSANSGNPV